MLVINWTLPRVILTAGSTSTALVLAMLFLVGAQSTASTAASAPQAPLPLPVTLLEVMRASVQIPADGIWAVQYNETFSEKEWLLAEQDAINITASATLISMGGTGKNDQTWISNSDWQAWALDIQKTGLQLRAAVKAKDLKMLFDAADHLTETCTACHTKYRPDKPSDGVVRYPFYPARILAK